MTQEVTNFARFYALFNKLPCTGDREGLRADIALLLACDYIYMLKDWELSKGAKLELDVASSCGIKVLFE